jgi:hypothetical protein
MTMTFVLHPADMVQTLARDKTTFRLTYGDTEFLLVRLPEGSSELAEGLAAAACKNDDARAVRPAPPMINYNTEILNHGAVERPHRQAARQTRFDGSALAQLLAECAHFIVPLRKRSGAEMLYADRISVGRARNKDIVLRHASVSKFHGWFQVDESGEFYFVDAGSKNKTCLNGRALTQRELAYIESGDRMKLGSVDAIVSSADTLWNAVHRTTHPRSTNTLA